MIKYFSFKDVASSPQFKNIHPLDLLHPDNDVKVKELLFQYGADVSKPLCVQACLHRANVDKKVEVGYRYVFWERSDEEWLNSKYSSIECRIVKGKHTLYQKELLFMTGIGTRLSTDGSGQVLSSLRLNGYVLTKQEKKEYEEYVRDIKALQKVQEVVRGKLAANEDVLWDIKSNEDRLMQDFLQVNIDYPENE